MSQIRDTQQHPNVEITVRNLGPIVEAVIDLRPLTVFIGPSNTGKTYFSILVYALHHIFSGFPRLLLPDSFGPDVRRQYLRTREASGLRYYSLLIVLEELIESSEEIQDVLKKLNTKDRLFKFSDLPQTLRDLIMAKIQDLQDLESELSIELERCFDVETAAELKRMTGNKRNDMSVSLKVHDENQELWNLNLKTLNSNIKLNGWINDDIILLPKNREPTKKNLTSKDLAQLLLGWTTGPRKSYYLPAARSGIMQSHRVIASSVMANSTHAGLGRLEVPTLSGVIADFMQRIILYEEGRSLPGGIKSLAESIESDVLSGQIHVKYSPSGYPEFHFHPRGMKEDMRMTQASSMVSEIAPLVLFLRGVIRPGDTLIIEEPEAHLHPGAQTEMAATLARLVRAGVRVVVTTHSDWLLKEIGNLIREGVLKKKCELRKKTRGPESWLLPDEVGGWHFYKEKPVEPLPFTNLDGIEPPEYEELAQDLYNRSAGLHNQLEETEGDNSSE